MSRHLILIFLTCILLQCCSDRRLNVGSSPDVNLGFTVIQGHLSGTLTYDKSPYKVINDLIVDSSQTLNIAAGVQIYFENESGIKIYGGINVNGTSLQPVWFSTKTGTWKGIQFINSTVQSQMICFIMENADVTLPTDSNRNGSMDINGTNVIIRNAIFRNNNSNVGGALFLYHSQSVITNDIFTNNHAVTYGGAIVSLASSNMIINNTFYLNGSYNYAGALILWSPVADNVQNNIFYKNTNSTGDPRISLIEADSSHYLTQYNFLDNMNTPLFNSSTDLHLSNSSVCKHSGNPDVLYNNSDGTRNDQGAYGGQLGKW